MFPVTGRYQLTKQPLRTYLKGGVGLSYALQAEAKYSGGSIQDAVIPIRASVGVGWLGGIGAEIPVGQKHRLLVEIRMAPHLVMDRVTRMANSRSVQLTVGVPLAGR